MRYETGHQLAERTGKTDTVVCTGCGAFVMDVAVHDRFHARRRVFRRVLARLAGPRRVV